MSLPIDSALVMKLDRLLENIFPDLDPHNLAVPFGPNWSHLPLFDLVLRPKENFEIAKVGEPEFEELLCKYETPLQLQAKESVESSNIKPFRFFVPMKPVRAAFPEKRMTIETVIELVGNDYPVLVEKKYDGAHHFIHIVGDRIQIISDDGERNERAFPRALAFFKKLGVESAIFEAEVELWENGEHKPREVVAGKIHSKGVEDEGMVFNVFGLLYLNGHSLVEKTETERWKTLHDMDFSQSTMKKTGFVETCKSGPF